MIVDSSALIAILNAEPEADEMMTRIVAAARRRLSVANYLETVMVAVAGNSTARREMVDRLAASLDIELVAVTVDHARLAADAFLAFGKGRHPARLNYGDCFAYALARATGEPLLFKGEDFARTDIAPAA